ncbi:MAG: hypothetical protein JXR52_05635 [Bacteroidales bacterium]|nr:hypothetical protein [Bacteroidales bacterium]MBN2698288.1 hypothetical protein [Bacteroidales bacterium]
MKKTGIISFFLLLIILLAGCGKPKNVIIISGNDDPKTRFGVEWLSARLAEAGFSVEVRNTPADTVHHSIIIGLKKDALVDEFLRTETLDSVLLCDNQEGYTLISGRSRTIIAGNDPSGTLYGCIELANRIKENGIIPEITFSDYPGMVLRGACVGLQKTEYLPGRGVYEYPYTPENFPWFYDQELWIRYLDMLVENRFNALFLWNGHPFASLVRLEDYPYAVEVDSVSFRKNQEIFRFLTLEAEKRGIWVIQMFYNIIVSKPFAEKHQIRTQDRSRPITPLISDYTRKSVASFIENYPNVGLMVCLGEAMNTYEDDVEWFTGTIIPGIRDGLESIGSDVEPPLILRGHDTDAKMVMEAALPLYHNLYTVYKYNGESLTTYTPRNSWADIPMALSELGSVHISNVHILANLEPFRYGSPDFIQKSTIAMHEIQGANGLHLYPQTSYWDWPYSADKVDGRLLQIERDWVWYKAWGRYAWNSYLEREKEADYWSKQFESYYGCRGYGREILKAYEETGEIAPKLLRRFGISDGNRQTLMLGMFMSQLVNPYKYTVYESFLNSNGPEGEILIDYARKEFHNEPHNGETPPQIIQEVMDHAASAIEAIEKAAPHVTNNIEEFERLRNDIFCYRDIAGFYADRVKAAMLILRYRYSRDPEDLKSALPFIEASLQTFKDLSDRTEGTYLYANSMQTAQRRIPISGRDGKNKTWSELLVHYEEEMEIFNRNVQMLSGEPDSQATRNYETLIPARIKVLEPEPEWFKYEMGQQVYSDRNFRIEAFAPELLNLEGLKLSMERQVKEGTRIRFRNEEPVKVLVGYFNGHSYSILSPPTLETNANANDRGQADIKIANGLHIPGLYPVNIYTYLFEPGENILELGAGRVMVLGFMDGNQQIRVRDAGIGSEEEELPIDWLFY